jgi:hypothetical protein
MLNHPILLTEEQKVYLSEDLRAGRSLPADHVEQLVVLLDEIGSSVRAMWLAEQCLPFDSARQDAFIASAWDPVAVAYVALAAAVAR